MGPFHQDRAVEVLCHLLSLCSSVRKGQRSPCRGPFPWLHSVSAKHLQLAFPWEGLPSGAWQRGGIFFEVLPPFPFSSHRCSLATSQLIFGLMLVCFMESELLCFLSESERQLEKECCLCCHRLPSQCATGHKM